MIYKLPESIEDNIFLIDAEGNTIHYSTFYSAQLEFQKSISARAVVLVLCENTPGAIMGLVSFLMNGQIPLLMESSTDSGSIQNLLKTYEIEYIFTTKRNHIEFDTFPQVAEIGDFVLLETGENSEIYPNIDLGLLLSTSGSTGSPKLVRLSYENIVSNARAIIEYLKITSDNRAITTLPLSYSFGFSIINTHVLAGASIILTDKSVVERGFWDAFQKYRPTSLSGVPFTFELLRRIKFFSKRPQESLSVITQAGGKMTNELILLIDTFSRENKIDFYVMYGQTEATARISYLHPSYTKLKLGSIGKAIPGGHLKLNYFDEDVTAHTNPSGELIFMGPNVMMGYAQNRLDLAKKDELESVLQTGDIASVDEDGFYFIVGRTKRFLKIHGKRVNLDEIESILSTEANPIYCSGMDDHLEIYTSCKTEVLKLKQIVTSKFGLNPLGVRIHFMENIPRLDSGKVNYKQLENRIHE
jgi:acyl-coenzyme A synthetase/AMP-(fatty) acid ligase